MAWYLCRIIFLKTFLHARSCKTQYLGGLRKLTWRDSSVKLKDVLSSELFSNLTNFLSDSIQFHVGFIQNIFCIWYTSNTEKTYRIKVRNAMSARLDFTFLSKLCYSNAFAQSICTETNSCLLKLETFLSPNN